MERQEELFRPTFASGFLDQHAGRIIADVHFAIVELVANSWDAGADEVRISWPAETGQDVAVLDNGVGMTEGEFLKRWSELSYNRLQHQGPLADEPEGRTTRRRVAFGRNGLGRHAMFHFNDLYEVETWKAGVRSKFAVKRTFGTAPFSIAKLESRPFEGHGTLLTAKSRTELMAPEELSDLIGSRFVADPEFRIFINQVQVTLTDLEHLSVIGAIDVPDVGPLTIRRFDAQVAGRTSKQSGVAWWVNRRLVGAPSWDVFDGPILDARTQTGRRFIYIVEADPLKSDVRPDWSGFYASTASNTSRQAVSEYVRDDLRVVNADIRRERKAEALRAHGDKIKRLPLLSQETVARFAEEIQVRSPTITPRDLENAVEVLAQLEQARTGYSLLDRLARLGPENLDQLDQILDEWSVEDAKRVLGELGYRLRLIKELEHLVERHTTDELHDLQPLFERGLWIFGPAFESISFTSNRTLATVVREHLGAAVLDHPRFRPDFVVLPDASIGIYSTDAFDAENEVSGLASVVIVELKRGGHEVGHAEKDQALGYSREIRQAGRVNRETSITAYVLGSTVNPVADEEATEGKTRIIPRRYSDVLRQAHARTFHLAEKLKASRRLRTTDQELAAIVSPVQTEIALQTNLRGTFAD